MQNKVKGSCLCGKVTYAFTGESKAFQYCHCSRCQKVTGSAHASNIIIDPEQFEWVSGEQFVNRYEVENAKYFATSFCQQCGSNLPWLTKNGKAMIIPAGTLDEDPNVKPNQNIYFADRASWYLEEGDLIKYDALPTKRRKAVK